jgi:hypothetical protein
MITPCLSRMGLPLVSSLRRRASFAFRYGVPALDALERDAATRSRRGRRGCLLQRARRLLCSRHGERCATKAQENEEDEEEGKVNGRLLLLLDISPCFTARMRNGMTNGTTCAAAMRTYLDVCLSIILPGPLVAAFIIGRVLALADKPRLGTRVRRAPHEASPMLGIVRTMQVRHR